MPGPYTEDHVTLDVALAFASYVHATGDLDYAGGWRGRCCDPSRTGSPRGSSGRGAATRSGARSGRVRSYQPVDNNAFTNMAAARALDEAVACADAHRHRGARPMERDRRRARPAARPARTGDRQPRRGAAGRGAGGRARGGSRAVSGRLSRRPGPGAGDLPLRRGGAGAPLRRRADAQRAARRLRRPRRRARASPWSSSSAATATSSRAIPRAGRVPGAMPDKPQASPMFANLSGYLTGSPVRVHRAPAQPWDAGHLERSSRHAAGGLARHRGRTRVGPRDSRSGCRPGPARSPCWRRRRAESSCRGP